MSNCLISNGISRACDFSVGGVKGGVWLANEADLGTISYDTDGQITGVTTGATWYEYQPELNSASFTQSLQAGQVSRFVQQTLAFSVASLTQAKIKTLDDLSLTTLVAIFQGNDGNWYFAGNDGSALKASALEVTTGAADTDDNIATVTLQGSNKGHAPTIDSDILAGMGIA
jgi:hypothetical protein